VIQYDTMIYGMIRFLAPQTERKYPLMSSNLRIVKICEYCKQEFIARTTVTQCCSDPCAKRFYKVKQREKAIHHPDVQKKYFGG